MTLEKLLEEDKKEKRNLDALAAWIDTKLAKANINFNVFKMCSF